MRQRDARLFYLSMEVTVRKAGVKTILALDDNARPAILQACHPKGDSRLDILFGINEAIAYINYVFDKYLKRSF